MLVSTVKNTPSDAPCDMNAHRLGVREWVENLQQNTPQWPRLESEHHSMRQTASPVAHTEEVLACHNPKATTPITPKALKQTAGEQVSWLDQLNQPSTSNPYGRDPPLHLQPPTPRTMAAGAPGGPLDSSSSLSTLTIHNHHTHQVPLTPKTPRCQERQNPPSHDGSQVPEYLHSHRSPTFNPVAPGGDLMLAPTPNQRGTAVHAPIPRPRFNMPDALRGRLEAIDPIN